MASYAGTAAQAAASSSSSPPAATNGAAAATSSSSSSSPSSAPAPAAGTSDEPRIEQLVLDAGPLLAQLPLRGMSKKYYIPPQVLAELKDKKAREHLHFLKLGGMDLEIREAGPEALAKVIAFAKQTGDYAVLSRPDLAVLALAYALEVERHGNWRIREELGGQTGQQKHEAERLAARTAASGSTAAKSEVATEAQQEPASKDSVEAPTESQMETAPSAEAMQAEGTEEAEEEPSEEEIARAIEKLDISRSQASPEQTAEATPGDAGTEPGDQAAAAPSENDGFDDDDDDDEGWTTVPSSSKKQREAQDYGGSDGEGDWITAENITKQKHKDLGLVTDEAMMAMRGEPAPLHPGSSSGSASAQRQDQATASGSAPAKKAKKSKGKGKMTVATMTADYAVQNVLLQMGMALVSTEGMRIEKVRSWVLRCHACFKICKDSERKFCPSCGNPTLIRTSVTSSAPGSTSKTSTSTSSDAASQHGLQLHLKKNFQYRNRGTIYSLPLPKPGSASSGKDPKRSAPILREDQVEWQRGLAQERVRRNKEQKALERALEKGKDTLSARYEDPDWLPGMGLLAGDSSRNGFGGLPDIGAGRRNPNQAKHGRRRK